MRRKYVTRRVSGGSTSQSSEYTPHPYFGRASSRDFLAFFPKFEVKATNCRAFRCSILGELDGVTVTQRVEPTAAAKLPSPVTMRPPCRRDGRGWEGRGKVGCKKRSEKSGKHGELPVFSAPFGISFIMRTRSTFSWSSSLVLAGESIQCPLDVQFPSDVRPLRSAHPSIELLRAWKPLPSHFLLGDRKLFRRTFSDRTIPNDQNSVDIAGYVKIVSLFLFKISKFQFQNHLACSFIILLPVLLLLFLFRLNNRSSKRFDHVRPTKDFGFGRTILSEFNFAMMQPCLQARFRFARSLLINID